jgi:hypothetical protein
MTWNAVTTANRYEVALVHFWKYAGSHNYYFPRYANCNYDDYRAHLGAAWLTNARDEVYGVLTLSTSGLTGGTTAIGEVEPQFVTTLAGPVGTH